MIPVSELKKDMEFYKSLGALIEVLKLLAAAQYQKLERKLKTYTVYLEAIKGFFPWLDVQKMHHPFVSQTEKPTAIIAVTTDAGLLGGLNALVMNEALSQLKKEGSNRLVILGRRGQLYVEKHKMVFANFPGITDEQRFEQALKLRDYIVNSVLQGRLGQIKMVFPRALSFAVQRIEVVQLLPFIPEVQERPTNLELSDIIFESELDNIVEYLVYLWLAQKIYEIFGLSRLAEQAARVMHLENCTQRLGELDKKLKFQYFRARHEIVDQNMRELFSARLVDER